MAQDGIYRMIPRAAVEDLLGSPVPFDWLEVHMPTFDAAMYMNLDAGCAIYTVIDGDRYQARQCNKNGVVVLAGDVRYEIPELTRVDVAEILQRMPREDDAPHPLRKRFGVPLESIIVDGSYLGPERRHHRRAQA